MQRFAASAREGPAVKDRIAGYVTLNSSQAKIGRKSGGETAA
jgi:ribosomal protein S17E